MKEPWQWQEDDIEMLLREQRPEDLQLEYKRSDALSKGDQKKKTEITKDVSAMANSAGGTIIYGIDEQRPHGPIKVDSGIDPANISTEWLEQVIDSGIHRRIDGISIRPIKVSSTGKLVYVVWIPQSSRAPHMAADHRYYKRRGTTTALMEEYEVRDVGRREESPDLDLDIKTADTGQVGMIYLDAALSNRSTEPAFYATCRLYVEPAIKLVVHPSWKWTAHEDTELVWHDRDRVKFHAAHLAWSVPQRNPILEGERYSLDRIRVDVGINFNQVSEVQRYNFGLELRAPKMVSKLKGLKLAVDRNGPRIEPHTYSLKHA
jgi:hypothetical protein